ncbi:hypothetical protein KIL84_004627, partial [Mauremys mutica]
MKILSFCHNSRASSPLPGFIVFFLICYVHKMESGKFTVIGPRDPVTAILGQEAVLPCHLSPPMSAANMEVRWFRSQFVSFVHLYRDGKDQYDGQLPEYWKRTELLKAGLTDGNVPLRILNVTLSDEGLYLCFIQDDTFYEQTVLELRVAGLGSAPLISVEGHQDGGIRVVCRSAGWYPKPEVLWKDLNGRHLPSLSETKSPGDNNLFKTETALIVTEHSNQNLSCCIRNTVLNQEKESAVYIAGQLPSKSHTELTTTRNKTKNIGRKELKHLWWIFHNPHTNTEDGKLVSLKGHCLGNLIPLIVNIQTTN